MKTFVIALVLCSVLASARALSQKEIEEKEAKAKQECNITIPVQSDPNEAFMKGIAIGKVPHFSQEENCFLHCFLQKVGLLDENANVKNPEGFVNFTVTSTPRYAKYSDVIIAQIFQTARLTKDIEDKCLKAFTTYHQIFQTYFVLEIANVLQKGGVNDKIATAIKTGQPVDEKFVEGVKFTLMVVESSISHSYPN